MEKLFLFFELVDSWSLNYYGLGWPGRTRGCATCGCAEWGFIYLCHFKKTKQWFLLKITWEPHKYIWGGLLQVSTILSLVIEWCCVSLSCKINSSCCFAFNVLLRLWCRVLPWFLANWLLHFNLFSFSLDAFLSCVVSFCHSACFAS